MEKISQKNRNRLRAVIIGICIFASKTALRHDFLFHRNRQYKMGC